MSCVLVFGLRATGAAVVPVLCAEGARVVVADDAPGAEGYDGRVAAVRAASADVIVRPFEGPFDWPAVLADLDVALVVPSPGVRPDHPLVLAARAASVPVRSEIDLAAERISAPIVAITGTNGKTTVTELVTRMLAESGPEKSERQVECAGNIGTPLITLAGTAADTVVAEVSSFQLEFTTTCWHPRVAALLNVADDHLDWHGDRANYETAKAKIFAAQGADDTLVINADDPAVVRLAAGARARLIEVRVGGAGDTDSEMLFLADGRELLPVSELPRALPHDRTNSLVAAEAALAAGASLGAVRSVLRSYRTLPHRVEFVAAANGISWYDDSKATNPHASMRAVAAFGSVVLCAGGLNKGLDLDLLAVDCGSIRAVVAFGAASGEIAAAFAGKCPVEVAANMDEVVLSAAANARPGDTVLLSPACASFDAYRNYEQRGDDFARAVRTYVATLEAAS